MIDLTDTIAPKSDQINADDLIAGPRTVTVTRVEKMGGPDQPVSIYTAEFGDGRPFKPCLSMRRVLIRAWEKDGSQYVGRRITLYCDPSVKFGRDQVGGIRISHLSHLPKRLEIALTATRGKRAPFVVDPLPDEPAKQPGALTPDARGKWVAAMVAALDEGGCGVDERPTVIGAILKRGNGNPVTTPESISDDELRAVCNTLKVAREGGGQLAELVSDALNNAALIEANNEADN